MSQKCVHQLESSYYNRQREVTAPITKAYDRLDSMK